MTNTCIQLSNPIDSHTTNSLTHLAHLFQEKQIGYFLLGATARDILFHHFAGCPASARRTNDIDISIQMDSWDSYNTTRDGMFNDGYTCPDKRHPEKLVDTKNLMEIDLLPFGEISEDGTSIVWPDDSSLWSILGFEEAYENAISTDLPSCNIKIASPAAMIYLKMIAVYDRADDRRKKDALDIHYILQNYNQVQTKVDLKSDERYQQALEKTDNDLLYANALIAGQDIGTIVQENTRARILEIIRIETESSSRCEIAHAMQKNLSGDFTRARNIFKMLKTGILER